MAALLKKEQVDDDDKKLYCEDAIDKTEDKLKELEWTISDLSKSIADSKEGVATLASEIKALEEGIVKLDKQVAEATEQRKEEHEDYEALMAADAAAQDILGFAKNRLNKFYNPKLYKPPPKRQITEAERLELAAGGTLAPTMAPGGIQGTGVTVLAQVNVHVQHKVAPPPPPAIGTYSKKGEE